MGGVSQVTVTPQGVQHVGGGAVRRERCFQLGNRGAAWAVVPEQPSRTRWSDSTPEAQSCPTLCGACPVLTSFCVLLLPHSRI